MYQKTTNPKRTALDDFELAKPEAGFVPALLVRCWAADAVRDGTVSALVDLADPFDCARALHRAGLIRLVGVSL